MMLLYLKELICSLWKWEEVDRVDHLGFQILVFQPFR